MKYNISTAQELEERFWQIPEDLQDAAVDPKVDASIKRFGREAAINEESLWKLTRLTFNILMAVEPIKGFAQRITTQTQISATAAQKIADEINENIFRPVRQSLIKIHEIPPSEQAEIPAVEGHFEHLLEIHSPNMIALAKPAAAPAAPNIRNTPDTSVAPLTPIRPVAPAPKTLAEQKMSRPTSLPPQMSRTSNEPDPYREPIA